ncbi:MAG: hypothetical protein E6Q40_14235 [Cupriavidus sp.]|nr:MAG: hypothetical protein E6Q40_14235 [Cupriavidus sp.]
MSNMQTIQPHGLRPDIRPAALYIEAFTSHEFPNVRWAKVHLTPKWIDRLLQLRQACVDTDLSDVRAFGGPAQWSGESQWRPDLPHLRVSPHDFWFEVTPKNVDAIVQTQAVPFETFFALLRQDRHGQYDSDEFKWINGALYCDGSSAELLADDVASS